jgi:60 kDa SS-A/Ro ribonucleoprotein
VDKDKEPVMVNLSIFTSRKVAPAATAVNEAGGRAYALSDKHALAQYAATGCLNNTFYTSGQGQLDAVRALVAKVDAEFVAKTAVYTRQHSHMKDMPALLLAELASRNGEALEKVFGRVCDNGKMLRNFVQIVRSGATGRRSLGTRPKRLVQRWLDRRTDAQVLADSVGNDPSLTDVLRMVHPKPGNDGRRALYGYLLGRQHDADKLPACVRAFEDFKAGRSDEVPDVPFQLLTGSPLRESAWRAIAARAGWQMLRMNLNTFLRHGVFDDAALTLALAKKLAAPDEVRKARVFPYQLLMAYKQADAAVPKKIRDALHDAMEAALDNVPEVEGQIYVLLDVSGSMHSPATGFRKGATSAVRCIDVAALVAAAFLRKNRDTTVIPFHDKVVPCKIDGRDSVLTNAQLLAKLPSGGTNCAVPLQELNRRKAKGDLVIYVSDNESWIDTRSTYRRGTQVMEEWGEFKRRNPKAQLVCIDVQPGATTQAPDRKDILNVGGFSDDVFSLIAAFARGGLAGEHWVRAIEAVAL